METPHPSIQTQDQIFKLLSSQPLYSPNLSPVPVATTSSRNLKENRVSIPWTEQTSKTLTSGGLGRSASVSSSNSSSSRNSRNPTKKSLKANMKPRSSKSRISKSGSGPNLAQALASPFVSRASSPINDQIDLPAQKPRPRTSTATNLGKRGLSDTFYNPNLPFPQTHERGKGKGRKYSVQNAHTSPSSKPPVLLDLNTQLKQRRRKAGHRGTFSVDATRADVATEQEVGKTKEGRQRERRPSAPSSYSLRPRPQPLHLLVDPPAGSQGSKTKKSRLASELEIIHKFNNQVAAGASTTAGIPTTAGSATNHTDDDGFVLPLLPHSRTKNPINTSAMEMDWRVGIIDFNRPPSQMCHYPTTTLLDGWTGGDVFSSSGSEGSSSGESDENDDNGTEINPTRPIRKRTRTARPLVSGSAFDDPFGSVFGFESMSPSDLNLNLHMDIDQSRFGDNAWGISTPLTMQIQNDGNTHHKEGKRRKKEKRMVMKATSASNLRSKNGGLVKMRSLPVMGGAGGKGMEMEHVDVNEGADNEERDQDEQDMDLTTPLITATAGAGAASTTLGASRVMQLVDGRGDMTPWIMDSLISPPSRFLEVVGKGCTSLEDDNDAPIQEQDEEQSNISSKTLSSSSSSEQHLLSSPFQLSSEAHVQPQSQPAATSSGSTAAASFTAKRTRSGTIVPSSHRISNNITNVNINDPPGTRRTRSGTLVGPLPITASGTGAQLVGSNGTSSVRRSRERSGTILAGPSSLHLPTGVGVGVGMGRTRSATVIGHAAPIPPVSLPVSALAPGQKETRPEILGVMSTTLNPKSSRSGAMYRAEHGPDFDQDDNVAGDGSTDINNNTDADDMDVEPHIDALYMPSQSSSPDPIDFLRLAHFQDYDGMRDTRQHSSGSGLGAEGREDEDAGGGVDEMVWCIADEPPSPALPRNESKSGRRYSRGGIMSVRRGRGMKGIGWREKGKGKTRTRFMIGGQEEQPDEIVVEPEEGEDSDDELLLMDGATLDIWE